MAKTTSQIIAENQKKREEAAAVGEQLSKIHERQMAEISGSASKTQAVLEKALSGTTNSTRKKEVESALLAVGGKKKTPSTPREEQISLRKTPETEKQKRDRTKYEYDNYVNSEEYRKKRTADIIAQQLAKDRDETQSFASTSDMTPPIPQDEKEMRLRAARDQAEKEYNEAEDKKRFESDMEVINGLSEEDRKRLEIYSASKYSDRELPDEYLVDSLLEDFGRERLDELERTFSRYKNAKRAEEVEAKAREFVSKRGGRGTLANILSVPVQAYSGIIGTGGQLAEMMIGTGGYKTMDPNAYGTIGQTLTGAIRGQTSENITEDLGDGFVGKAANIGYQGVIATADTIARGYLGGGAFGGATLAATGSFSQTMADASKQGATPAQAALLATTTAALEAATEKIPLDRLIKQAGGGKQAVTTILKNALVQGGIEATTEEISLVGSLLLEAAVLREKSNYEQTVMVQIMQGKSPTEAREIAARQLWDEVINTALVSMISGGASSVAGSVKANIEADRQDVTPNATNSEGMKQELMQKLQEIEGQKEEPAAEAPVVQSAEPVMDGQQTLEQMAQSTDNTLSKLDTQGIEMDMDEPARQTVLSAKQVHVVEDSGSAGYAEDIRNIETLPAKAKSKVEKLIRPLAEKLGILNKDLKSPAVEVDFQFSKNKGLKESLSKQLRYGGSYADFAKALSNLERILDHAVLIEKHGDKYKGTVREDRRLESVSVLMGAFRDGNTIIPVQMEIKKSSQNGGQLYVTVAMTKIEADVLGSAVGKDQGRSLLSTSTPEADVMGRAVGENQAPFLLPASEYSLADIFSKINPADKHFLKYVPDSMLTAEQVQAKRNALEEDFTRIAEYERTDGKTREDVRAQFAKYGLPAERTPAKDTYAGVQMGASNVQEQSAKGGQVKGTGAAEQNFSGKAEYQNLLSEENTQRDRPGDVRPMEIPKTDSFGRHVSELVGNAYGAEITTDKMANTIEELVQEGALGFDRRSNQESMNTAAAEIQRKGVAATRTQITNAVARGKIKDGDIEQAILLYAMYNSKDTQAAQDNASEILVDLATMANITGRNLQMFRLLRKLTPEGQVSTITKTVQKNVESMVRSGAVKKGYTPDIDPELLNQYRKAAQENMRAVSEEQKKSSAEKMQLIMDYIYKIEASKMPATMKAKWDAWRYMSMLGNAKTQVRNVVGNVAFMPYKVVKDKTAALAEKLLVSKDQRTKSLHTDPKLLEWAKQDSKSANVADALKYSAKLGDDVTSQKFRDQMQVFKSKKLDGMRKFVEAVPAKADLLFKNGYYAFSLADFMRSRGYKAADIQNGSVSQEVLNEARAYAIQEAMKATFNDSNVVSDFLATEARYKGENPVGKIVNTAFEGVMPFRRTPANVAVRFEEYSPLGIVNTLWKAGDALITGKTTAASVVDSLASSLTGSAAMLLGYCLAKGLGGFKLTGSNTDEDEKRQGHQAYALEFADKDEQEYSYKIDWAAPANLPLFVGANIQKSLEAAGADTDISKFSSFLRGLGNAFEPMLALSCLSGINDLFESARYAGEGEALYTVASQIATGYITQGIPALLRQADQATQENKQITFADSNDPTVQDLQTTGANVPFVGSRFKTDKVTPWGEKENTGTTAERIINAFVNPGTLKKIDNSPLEQEIARLNKAQDTNVSPDSFPKVVSYTDKQGTFHKNHRLTEDQYQQLATTQGQTAKTILDKMISSANYKAMTDEQKAKAMDMAYSYAREKAMAETLGTEYSESWMLKLKNGSEAEQILHRTADNALSSALSKLDTAWVENYSKENTAVYSQQLETAFESYSKMNGEAKAQVKATATGTAAKYIEAREKGISHEDVINAVRNINNVKGTGAVDKDTGKPNVRDIDKREAIAKTTGLSVKEIDIMMKAYMGDYDPNDAGSDKTELKYNYIRQELGLTPAQYAATYRASLDNDKKKDKVAAIVALGFDQKTATALYNVYASNAKGKKAYMAFYEKNGA